MNIVFLTIECHGREPQQLFWMRRGNYKWNKTLLDMEIILLLYQEIPVVQMGIVHTSTKWETVSVIFKTVNIDNKVMMRF